MQQESETRIKASLCPEQQFSTLTVCQHQQGLTPTSDESQTLVCGYNSPIRICYTNVNKLSVHL